MKKEALNEEILHYSSKDLEKADLQANLQLEQTHFVIRNEALVGTVCPNCGARLDGRKCKLLCPTAGCGYMVTCSEW